MCSLRTTLLYDRPYVLRALSSFLNNQTYIQIVDRFDDLEVSLTTLLRSRPDLVVMGAPKIESIMLNLIGRIKAEPNPPSVVVLIPEEITEYRTRATRAGADGCILQSDIAARLPLLIRLLKDRE